MTMNFLALLFGILLVSGLATASTTRTDLVSPTILKSIQKNDQVNLTYEVPNITSRIEGFKVFYTTSPEENFHLWKTFSVPYKKGETSLVLPDLQKNQTYTLKMAAFNGNGLGPMSGTGKVMTFGGCFDKDEIQESGNNYIPKSIHGERDSKAWCKKCGNNEYLLSLCTESSDTNCRPCDNGFYNNKMSHLDCNCLWNWTASIPETPPTPPTTPSSSTPETTTIKDPVAKCKGDPKSENPEHYWTLCVGCSVTFGGIIAVMLVLNSVVIYKTKENGEMKLFWGYRLVNENYKKTSQDRQTEMERASGGLLSAVEGHNLVTRVQGTSQEDDEF